MPQSFRVVIKGVSPYSQSKFVDKDEVPKEGKETADMYEKRTWQCRIHVDPKSGHAFMPPMSLKKSLEAASKYAGKIPGERNATYSKRFKSGLLVTDQILLYTGDGKQARPDDFEGEWLHLNADGKPGSGTRVKRRMPRLVNWSAEAIVHVIDEVISDEVLERVLSDAGRFVGVGRFRPESGGFYGRFLLDSMEEA